MKRITIIGSILVVVGIFLLWPTTQYGSTGDCNDTGTKNDFNISPNCLPAEDFGSWGGGAWYIGQSIGNGALKQSTSNSYNFYVDYDTKSGTKIFRPVEALKISIVSGLVALIAGYLLVYMKRKKQHKQPHDKPPAVVE